ncbi:MAG TPA: prolipoprotein diacylglyceryl transferase family protein [Candidatus Angelobacter sp.]
MTYAKILYGALFMILLPGLLLLWARAAQSNIAMPVYGSATVGGFFALAGLVLMLAGMFELWRHGGGLPMNAFPPPALVSIGTFRWLPHPIYTGFVAICLGVSMTAKSASGLWLVTPTMVLGCTALVLGHEHLDLKRRFGQTLRILPADEDAAPTTLERIQVLLLVIVPWLALYEFTIKLPLPGISFGFPFEDHLPIYSWTTVIYESTYITVALAPWCARTRRDLRRFMISAWTAMAIVFPFYWFLPSSAPRRPLLDTNIVTHLLSTERSIFPPTATFPSFHVLWAVFVARLYRPRWLGISYVAAIAVTCVTTGMHYIADVVAALALAPLLLEPQRAWEALRRGSEWLANSWREWRIGSVRIINHGFYAGAASLVQVLIVLAALRPGQEWKVLVTAITGLIGAAAWAQWVEGSSRLRRPFGFYGGLIGVGLGCLLFPERWILVAAHCLGAPWMQALGRLRCLVNGCCHGGPTGEATGIRVNHPRSRVTHLAELAGVPIHATQLYSILGNIVLGFLMMRLWISGCPLSLIVGVYCIVNGISRFIEEAYRGEPQTPQFLGLRLYQWIAVGMVIFGAVLTSLHSPPPPTLNSSLHGLVLALAFAAVAAAAMGVDFPESNRPLARLT